MTIEFLNIQDPIARVQEMVKSQYDLKAMAKHIRTTELNTRLFDTDPQFKSNFTYITTIMSRILHIESVNKQAENLFNKPDMTINQYLFDTFKIAIGSRNPEVIMTARNMICYGEARSTPIPVTKLTFDSIVRLMDVLGVNMFIKGNVRAAFVSDPNTHTVIERIEKVVLDRLRQGIPPMEVAKMLSYEDTSKVVELFNAGLRVSELDTPWIQVADMCNRALVLCQINGEQPKSLATNNVIDVMRCELSNYIQCMEYTVSKVLTEILFEGKQSPLLVHVQEEVFNKIIELGNKLSSSAIMMSILNSTFSPVSKGKPVCVTSGSRADSNMFRLVEVLETKQDVYKALEAVSFGCLFSLNTYKQSYYLTHNDVYTEWSSTLVRLGDMANLLNAAINSMPCPVNSKHSDKVLKTFASVFSAEFGLNIEEVEALVAYALFGVYPSLCRHDTIRFYNEQIEKLGVMELKVEEPTQQPVPEQGIVVVIGEPTAEEKEEAVAKSIYADGEPKVDTTRMELGKKLRAATIKYTSYHEWHAHREILMALVTLDDTELEKVFKNEAIAWLDINYPRILREVVTGSCNLTAAIEFWNETREGIDKNYKTFIKRESRLAKVFEDVMGKHYEYPVYDRLLEIWLRFNLGASDETVLEVATAEDMNSFVPFIRTLNRKVSKGTPTALDAVTRFHALRTAVVNKEKGETVPELNTQSPEGVLPSQEQRETTTTAEVVFTPVRERIKLDNSTRMARAMRVCERELLMLNIKPVVETENSLSWFFKESHAADKCLEALILILAEYYGVDGEELMDTERHMFDQVPSLEDCDSENRVQAIATVINIHCHK